MDALQVVSGVQDEYVEPRLCALKALPNVASTATLSKSDVKALARIVVVHISANDSDVRHAAEHAYAVLCTNPGKGAIDMLAVKNGQRDSEVIPPPVAPARQRVAEPPAPAVTYPAGAVGDEVALLVAQVIRPPRSSQSIDFTAVVVIMTISLILAYVAPRLFRGHDH